MTDEKSERNGAIEIIKRRSNFDFLFSEFPELAQWGIKAEKGYVTEPVFCISAIQILAEILVNFIFEYEGLAIPYDNSRHQKIELLRLHNIISPKQSDLLDSLRKTSNKIKHQGESCSKSEALSYLKRIFGLCCWFKCVYGISESVPSKFYEPIPKKAAPLLSKSCEDIPNRLQQEKVDTVTAAKPAISGDGECEEDENEDEDKGIRLSPEEIDAIVSRAVARTKATLSLKTAPDYTGTKANPSTNTLKAFFESKGLEVIDKRSSGGCLWVVGSKTRIHSIITEACIKYNITGAYCGGGKATSYRDAWFTKCDA